MKIKFKHSKNARTKSGYFAGMCPEVPDKAEVFYCVETMRWLKYDFDLRDITFSLISPCNSIRAFRRLLKQIPAGSVMNLIGIDGKIHATGVGSLTSPSSYKRNK